MSTSVITVQSEKLRGNALKIARGAWFVMAVFTLILFSAGVKNSFEIGLKLLPESQTALTEAGLSLRFPAYVLVITDIITVLFFALTALIIVLRRGDEVATLVVASMLLFTGGLYTGPTANANFPNLVLAILPGLAETIQACFVYLVPDARPLPRWMC